VTNTTKWLIAWPFSFLVACAVPALTAGSWLWFVDDAGEAAYVILAMGMWIVATAFVDAEKPCGSPDLANGLIPAGLILSVPVAVFDCTRGLGQAVPGWPAILGASIALCAILVGIAARGALSQSYSPRGSVREDTHLARHGPYRWIRHPVYLSAILWSIAHPLLVRSFIGSVTAFLFIVPAVGLRIRDEERNLVRALGEEYIRYQDHSWKLIPFIY
jgi:protein-S-isoprenylcysteine O-methyltransferase Ste14